MRWVAVAAAGALDLLDRGVRGFGAGVGDAGDDEGLDLVAGDRAVGQRRDPAKAMFVGEVVADGRATISRPVIENSASLTMTS